LKAVRRILFLLAALCVPTDASANAFQRWIIGGAPSTACTWIGSVLGSCLPSTDTTDQVVAPRQSHPTFSDVFSFGGSQNLLQNGSGVVCPGYIQGVNAADCTVTAKAIVCATPGNVASNTHPWSNEGVVAWQPTGTVSYNPRDSGTYYSGIPAFSPPLTFESTTGSQTTGSPNYFPSFMTSVCGANTSGYFVDGLLGDMPNLVTATSYMGSNDTLTVSAQPAGFPFWPTGENPIGPRAGSTSSISNPTVTFNAAANFGYPAPNDKGFLLVENNGTTINNGICYWVNPSNNQACIAWDAGLDLTVNGFYGDTAGMGMFRANIRQGITSFTNDIFANMGCMDGACAYGHNHNIYLGTVPNAGFDEVFAVNLSDPDVLENGWNLKLRTPNSSITQSFFGARVNNGSSSSHGPIDYPCGGTHSVTYSALETNQYSFNLGISNQSSSFLASADEERGTNVATTPAGAVTGSGNCPTTMWVPNSNGIAVTVTGPTTFTTTVNPATFVPLITFAQPNSAALWDLGVSGMMVNGPATVANWSGPVGGVYTVQMSSCFNGEGTIPLTNPGLSIYACFAGTGAVTLYATGGAVSVLSNTSTIASVSVLIDPRQFGIVVGDTLSDPGNSYSITSITGGGPYTIAMSCARPSFAGGPNCINSSASFTVASDPVVSGTYNSGTGAVSLTLGADVGLTNGSSVTVQNLFGTGSVASLNGTFTATTGTGGTTLNYAAATGLTLTIGGSSGGVVGPSGLTFPAAMDSLEKTGPIQLVANTAGSGCDGVNLLCGIQYDPRAHIVWHGEQVVGTGIASGYGCMVAGQIASIQPVGGSTGTGYAINDTITLSGGTEEANAVVTVTSVSSGHVTGDSVTTGGVYTSFATSSADHKTFTQGTTSGSGTGAQFQFPQPAPIVTGSGPYTLRLAQASGVACIAGAVTAQTYQIQTPTSITWDHDLIGWDGICPNASQCLLLSIANKEPWNLATISNSIVWTDVAKGGPVWGSGSGGSGYLAYGMTDGGGNIQCNNRVDPGTSARCAIPPFTAATFTGSLTGTALTANCSGSCMTIGSGTYSTSTGIVTLTVSKSGQVPYGGTAQVAFTVAGLTGSGTSLASLNGNWIANSDTAGTTLTYTAPAGLGSIAVTGGNVNPASGAAACRPGMYVWDNAGQFNVGQQGYTISGTRIVSGSSPNFTVAIPPGGVVSTDIPSTTLSCGWGMPSSAFKGVIDSSGVLTISADLVGSVHAGDYLADVSGSLPDNVQLLSGSGSVWQTNYSGGVAAEYMVGVRGPPTFGQQATTYIDPSAAGGGDGSIGRPFSSWASATAACGKTFAQKRGTSWTGDIPISLTCTANTPIILTSYGSGPQPIILGSVALSGAYARVVGLNVTSSSGNAFTIGGTGHHNQVIGNTVPGGVSGVLVDVNTGVGNQVLGNTITGVANVCITTEGSTATLGATTVAENVISNCGFDGIEVLGNYGVFTNNTITAWGQLHSGTSGIHVFTTSGSTGLGQFNTITGNVATYGVDTTGQDGVGFELDQWTSHNTVSGNFGFGNAGACISLYDASSNTVSGNTCVNNSVNGGGTHTFLAEEIFNSALGLTTGNANSGNILLPSVTTNFAVYSDSTSEPPAGNTFATDTYQNISGAGNVYNVNGTVGSSQSTWNTFWTATDSFTGVPLTHQPVTPPAYDFTFPASSTFTIDGVSRTLVGWTRAGGLYYQ